MSTAPLPRLSSAARRDPEAVAEAGRTLLQALFAASRLCAVWGADSKLTTDAVTNLMEAVAAATNTSGEAVLRFADDLVYLEDRRLRVDFAGYMAFRHVQDRCAKGGIGEIRISGHASPRELVGLLIALETRQDEELSPADRFEALAERLRTSGITGVTLGPECAADGRRGRIGPQDVRQAAAQAYFRLLFATRRATGPTVAERKVEIRRLKRAVHELVDVLVRGETEALALAQIRNYHGRPACHAANVCVHAVALGLRIGMHKRMAADLGLAALVHESVCPAEPAADEGERAARQTAAARTLLAELGFSPGALRAVLATRDVFAPSGSDPLGAAPTVAASAPAPAPAPAARPGASLFQRILAVCCFHDTMTTPAATDRPGALEAVPSEEVLRGMLRAPDRFDPDLVLSLRSLLGAYPFGTHVTLDTGETAIVHARNPHFEQPERPVVRLLSDTAGNALDGSAIADLSHYDRERGAFSRSVTKATPAHVAWNQATEYVNVLGS